MYLYEQNSLKLKEVISRKFISLIVITALFAVLFTSCKKDKDDDEVQLLETIKYSSGSYDKYEYDDQNRITKISWYGKDDNLVGMETFTYSGNDLVKHVSEEIGYAQYTYEFSRSGNTISLKRSSSNTSDVRTNIMELDNDGMPVKYEENYITWNYVISYQIKDENLMVYSHKDTLDDIVKEQSITYKYDNNKSPFFHCKTPKWFIFMQSGHKGSKNNAIEETRDGETYKYEYAYDNAGFLIKTTERDYGSEIIEYVTEYSYKIKN